MIREAKFADHEIAGLLKKHWKVANITKDEQHKLDHEYCLKSEMPYDWRFEDGDTFARLKLAGISLI